MYLPRDVHISVSTICDYVTLLAKVLEDKDDNVNNTERKMLVWIVWMGTIIIT